MSPGERLSTARTARQLSIAQAAAATRIRQRHLEALESERWDDLPAPAYIRGYLRTYAAYLDLDAAELLEAYEQAAGRGSRGLAIRPFSSLAGAPGLVVTAPAAGAIGLGLLVLAFTGYVYHEVDSLRTPPATPAPAATTVPSPSAAPSPTPIPSPTPVWEGVPPLSRRSGRPFATDPPNRVKLVLRATGTVWIDVQVDGKPEWGDSGKVLQPGDTVSFDGIKFKVTSGRAANTLVTVNGRDLGALGDGVVTREFTAQT